MVSLGIGDLEKLGALLTEAEVARVQESMRSSPYASLRKGGIVESCVLEGVNESGVSC